MTAGTVGIEGATVNTATIVVAINPAVKKATKANDILRTNDRTPMRNVSNVRTNQPSIIGSVRAGSIPTENPPKEPVRTKSKDYSTKKFPGELDSKITNYHQQSIDESSMNHQHYKFRSGNVTAKLPPRLANHLPRIHVLHKDNYLQFGTQHPRPQSRNDAPMFMAARKVLENQSSGQKIAQVNFPPLRAPQSIVNVRHPFVTEARTKRSEITVPTIKPKSSIISSLRNSIKELEPNRQTFHGYGNSPIATITNVQSLGNITNIPQYARPESFAQPTVASVLFPDTPQFPQSPSFSTAPVGQLNQFQTYDPGSFATTPVTVNPVISQFPAESSIPYTQFESPPQFVQTNHYQPAELTNNPYQYQTAGVGQIQESPLFIQSLQSPIAVSDQYAVPNYARAVRTEMIPRLRRPPRLNK